MSEWCQTGWGKAAVAVYCKPEPRGWIDWLCWADIYANPVAYAVMTSLDNLGRCLREASGLAMIEQRGARLGTPTQITTPTLEYEHELLDERAIVRNVRKFAHEKTDVCSVWDPDEGLWVENDAHFRERVLAALDARNAKETL